MATITDDFAPEASWGRRATGLIIFLAVLGAIGFGVYHFFFAGSGTSTTPTVQQTAKVTNGSLVTSFTTTGTAASTLSSKLTFQGTGAVKEADVKVGDTVKAGQVLGKLDDTSAQRSLTSAQDGLQTAQLNLQQTEQPPTASDVASAEQAIVSAQSQILTAQQALQTLQAGPASSDELSAQSAVTQAQNGVTTANNAVTSAQTAIGTAQTGVTTAYTSLVAAQASYCTSATIIFVTPCQARDIPLSAQAVNDLTNEIRNPPGTAAQGQAITSAAQGLMNASNAYLKAQTDVITAQQGLVNAQNGVVTAQQGVATAEAKLAALNAPPTDAQVAAAQSAVSNAQAGLVAAQAKYTTLLAGPTATTIALQEQQVKQAELNVQTAQDAINQLTMIAPYDGVVGAAVLNVGDNAAADSVTLSDPTGIQVALTVSETDLPGIKTGQYGVATFDALSGSFYLVKIISVSTVPTVTQGVVTYPVTAQLLRPADLTADSSELTPLLPTLQTLLVSNAAGGATTSGATTGGFGGGFGGGGGRGNSAPIQVQPSPATTPSAGTTPGTGRGSRTGGGGGAGSGTGSGFGAGGAASGAGLLRLLANAPSPDPGMTAAVTVLEKVVSNTLIVPTGAIKRAARTSTTTAPGVRGGAAARGLGQTYVIVQNADGTTKNVDVVTGGSDSKNTAITSGVTEGETVLLGSVTTATKTGTPTTGGPGALGGGTTSGATGGIK